MPVAVNQPSQPSRQNPIPERTRESDLDKVLKAAQVANTVFGIAVNVDTLRTNVGKREENSAHTSKLHEETKNLTAKGAREDKDWTQAKEEKAAFDERGEITDSALAAMMNDQHRKIYNTGEHGGQKHTLKRTGENFWSVPTYDQKREQAPQDIAIKQSQEEHYKAGTHKLSKEAQKIEKEMNSVGKTLKDLPLDTQVALPLTATQNEHIGPVRTKLVSGMDQMMNIKINGEERRGIGYNLIKALTSDIGRITSPREGQSEALTANLDYQVANIKELGSFIGTDIPKFMLQAANGLDNVREIIKHNDIKIALMKEGATQSAADATADQMIQEWKKTYKSERSKVDEFISATKMDKWGNINSGGGKPPRGDDTPKKFNPVEPWS